MKNLNLFDMIYDEYHIDGDIKLIECFAGYGSQALGLRYLLGDEEFKKRVTHHRICEWAIPSIISYAELHKDELPNYGKDYCGEMTREEIAQKLFELGVSSNYNEPAKLEQLKRMPLEKLQLIFNSINWANNLVDISRVTGKGLEINDTDKCDYIFTYSFPCFTKDSLVLTQQGYKKIIDVNCGDYVLSHDNNYHKVVNKFNNGLHPIYKINAMGVDEIKTTMNHKFYVREKYRTNGVRKFKEPTWKELKDITNNDYLGIAINQVSKDIVFENLPTNDVNFWWIIGRFLGDGWWKADNRIIICCAKNELNEITPKLDSLKFKYHIEEDKSTYKIHITVESLGKFVFNLGLGAANKHLTGDIINLPNDKLMSLIQGYISADGCFITNTKTYKISSISRELIYGMAQCIAKVYKQPYRIYKINPPKTKVIESRLVNQNPWYQLVFKTDIRKQDKAFYENGYIWYPIKSIESFGIDDVYDIEVEDSHSFTVQNTIVHNCQDLSLAGKQAGLGEGTRSGLLSQVERILKECNELGKEHLPQILLMENVPPLISEKFFKSFEAWCYELTKLGYSNFYKILNGKDFGVPQNRERVFMISILGDYTYKFPKPIPLRYKLKDLLEKNVDESYFLSKNMIDYISNTNEKWTGNNNGAYVNKSVASTLNTGEGSKRCDASNYMSDELPDDYDIQGLTKHLTETFQKNDIKECEEYDLVDAYNKTINKTGINPTLSCKDPASDDKYVFVKEPEENKIDLKRGYAVPVGKEQEETNDIDYIGNYSKSNYNQTPIVGKNGIAPTVTENHGQVTAITVEDDRDEMLKTELCNKLVKDGLVEEGDVVKHSYTQQILDGNKKCVEKSDGVMITLTTRGDCVGVCVNDEQPTITEPRICASRGRNPENPNSREKGVELEQRIELGPEDTSNTLTTVQKDNYVIIPEENKTMGEKLVEKVLDENLVEEGDVFDYTYSGDRLDNFRTQNKENKDCCATLRTKDALALAVRDKGPYVDWDGTYEIDCRAYKDEKYAPTLNTFIESKVLLDSEEIKKPKPNLRIRKLTERECFRLMGVVDRDNQRLIDVNSKSLCYHLSGDSIITSCILALLAPFFPEIDVNKKLEELANNLCEVKNDR